MTTANEFFTQLTLTEKYPNLDVLKTLAQVDTSDPDYDSEHLMSFSEQQKIIKCLRALDQVTGESTITYQLSDYGFGRLWAVNSNGEKNASHQSMWNPIRRLICDYEAMEIDGANMQPTILIQLLVKYTFCSSKELENYIKNRDSILANVMKHYKVERAQAKDLFLILMNGGSFDTWKANNELDKSVSITQDIYNIESELARIRTITAPASFPDYERYRLAAANKYESALEKWMEGGKQGKKPCNNIPGSTLALYLQDQERKIMGHVHEFLVQIGRTPISLVHDAFIVDRPEDIDRAALTQFVKEQSGFVIEFKHSVLGPTEEDKALYEKHLPFVLDKPEIKLEHSYSDADDERIYKKIKREFEKTNMKFFALAEYGMVLTDSVNGNFQSKKRADFKESHLELGWIRHSESTTPKGRRESFIDRWFLDPNKRKYNDYGFLPPPMTCGPSTYNLWTGFPIENLDIEPKDPHRVLELISILANYDETCIKYITDWLAQIIQEPGRKSGTMLIFKSQQGAGKGTLYKIMEKILGTDYAAECSNPAVDIFGTHGNGHVNKLLCSLDEVKSSDTAGFLNRLKNLITSERTQYNEKFSKQVQIANHARFMISTNASIPIHIEDGESDRRLVLMECSNEKCKDSEYWKTYYETVVEDMGVIRGFYNFLKDRDISNVNWMDFPKTELRKELIGASLHPVVFWFDEFIRNEIHENTRATAAQLHDSYERYAERKNIKLRFSNSRSFGIAISDKLMVEINKSPEFEDGMKRAPSNGVRYISIDRQMCFDWLKSREWTSHESLDLVEDNGF